MKHTFKAAPIITILGLLLSGCSRAEAPVTASPTPNAASASEAVPTPSDKASVDKTSVKDAEPTMMPGPNAVPLDTRVVVNIPTFRMDVFANGSLIKSYKIGIGYQQFPLPQGLRKAEMIIFNPTWTQPNESWASDPGEIVPAGSKGNPLGPIKVPIGGANLIHGGKQLAKIGNFASHGCVGMTNAQVKDFARVLAQASHTDLTEATMAAYLSKRTRTQVVKLGQLVPVELRYETIVFEDGRLHIYRDVYNQTTNTEENLRAVFKANGASFDGLAPLLAMLNSCAAGVSVVNIDNGFGAGYLAAQINALSHQSPRD